MEEFKPFDTYNALETEENYSEPPSFAVDVSFDSDASFWRTQRLPASSSSNRPYNAINDDRWVDDRWADDMCSQDADRFLSSMQKIDRKIQNRNGKIRRRESQHKEHGNREPMTVVEMRDQLPRDDDNYIQQYAVNQIETNRIGVIEPKYNRSWNSDRFDDVLRSVDHEGASLSGSGKSSNHSRKSALNDFPSNHLELIETEHFHSMVRHLPTRKESNSSIAGGSTTDSFANGSVQSIGSGSKTRNTIKSTQPYRQLAQRMHQDPSPRSLRASVLEQRRLKRCGTLDSAFILDDLQDMQSQIESVQEERQESSSGYERRPVPRVVDVDVFPLSVSCTTSNCAFYPKRSLWKLLWEKRWEWAEERLQLYPEEAKQPIDLQLILLEEKAGCTVGDDGECDEELDDVVYPLHLACVVRPVPPTSLVQKLVDAFPEACFHAQPSSGRLPVHMASDLRSFRGKTMPSTANWVEEVEPSNDQSNDTSQCTDSYEDFARHGDIVWLLLAQYPESVLVRENIHQMIPLHVAASTATAENGIVSPSVSRVLEHLVAAGPPGEDLVTTCQDANGLTPQDWAWQNVDYFCPRCGMENMTTSGGGYDCIGGKDASKEKRTLNGGGDVSKYGEALLILDAGMRCKCQELLSVTGKCLHPLLRKEIYSHLLETRMAQAAQSMKPKIGCESSYLDEQDRQKQRQIRTDSSVTEPVFCNETIDAVGSVEDDLRYSDDGSSSNYFTKKHESQPANHLSHRIQDAALDEAKIGEGEDQQEMKETLALSPRVIDSIRNNGIVNVDVRTTKPRLEGYKTAILHMKIRLSGLVHPSKHGRRRSFWMQNYFNGNTIKRLSSCHASISEQSSSSALQQSKHKVPVPYFEVFASHRRGMSKSQYKSYPILGGSTEGTWEDAFLDLGLTHEQLRHGTSGGGRVKVGFRVMHCPRKGSRTQQIGTCVVSLETLERQRDEQLRSVSLNYDSRKSDGVVVNATGSLKEPEMLPILNGFEVTGKLQVLSFSIE